MKFSPRVNSENYFVMKETKLENKQEESLTIVQTITEIVTPIQEDEETKLINKLHFEVQRYMLAAKLAEGEALARAKHCGDLLIKKKQELPYGEFGKYIREQINFSHKRCTEYMLVAEHWETLIENNLEQRSVREALRFIKGETTKTKAITGNNETTQLDKIDHNVFQQKEYETQKLIQKIKTLEEENQTLKEKIKTLQENK